MRILGTNGYVQQSESDNRCYAKKLSKHSWRGWFLVTAGNTEGIINVGKVIIPKELIGKKVTVKIEVLEDKIHIEDDNT